MEKYNIFKKIKIEDTSLIQNNTKDQVYNIMLKNNIKTLKDLFILDDLNLIDYGNKKNYIRIYQTKGVIKLLRTCFLGEDLPFKKILESNIENESIIIDNKIYKLSDILLNLGLTFNAAISIRNNSYDNIKVIELLEKSLKDNINLLGFKKEEQEKNINRLTIIFNWYYKQKEKINKELEDLKELKEQIIELKTINDNNLKQKIDLILSKKINEIELKKNLSQ